MEEHLPLHHGQARGEREKEKRRKAVSKVLIASRSVADCDVQVVAEGIYSPMTWPDLLLPKNDFQKTKNFPFFNL